MTQRDTVTDAVLHRAPANVAAGTVGTGRAIGVSMRKSKKDAALEKKYAWAAAVREGRVVSYNGGERFRSFSTVAEAEAEVVRLSPDMPCAIARAVNIGVL